MNVLLIGSEGQLGKELVRSCPDKIDLKALGFPDIDITDMESIDFLLKKYSFDLIINAAAYTNVDKAEKDQENAYRVNYNGVKNLALKCYENKLKLVHISTDFVFSGTLSRPYKPDDLPEPLSVYGRSKLKGENAVLKRLDNALIIRTAWLYSSNENNFVRTMLKLMKNRETLSIVDDQIGTPTFARGLAKIVWQAVKENLTGIHHWTDAGVASWYDFAVAIQEEASAAGLIDKQIPIEPIPAKKYPTPAQRPVFSVLDKESIIEATKVKPQHWRKQLRIMIKEIS